MARIRTIKPDFWTDDAVAELSPTAMLLFIGMWNFCDDEGYLPDSTGQLRRQIFPDRGWDVAGALDELLRLRRVLRFDSDQGPILSVPNFTTHQKISHPTLTKFTRIRPPGTQIPEDSGALQSILEGSALKEGKEGRNGEEGKGGVSDTEPPLRCSIHTNSTNPPACGLCKDARIAHEAWENQQGATVHQLPRKPIIHMPGLCDAHRQPEATCEMCEREARETIQAQFGGTA